MVFFGSAALAASRAALRFCAASNGVRYSACVSVVSRLSVGADCVCALSDKENTNLVAAQIAKHKYGVKKVIACTYDTEEFEMFKDVGVSPISATDLTVDAFIHEIHDKEEKADNQVGVHYVTLFGDNFKFKGFKVDEALHGTKLKNLSDTDGGTIIGVIRDGRFLNFDPSLKVEINDKVIVTEVYE